MESLIVRWVKSLRGGKKGNNKLVGRKLLHADPFGIGARLWTSRQRPPGVGHAVHTLQTFLFPPYSLHPNSCLPLNVASCTRTPHTPSPLVWLTLIKPRTWNIINIHKCTLTSIKGYVAHNLAFRDEKPFYLYISCVW